MLDFFLHLNLSVVCFETGPLRRFWISMKKLPKKIKSTVSTNQKPDMVNILLVGQLGLFLNFYYLNSYD